MNTIYAKAGLILALALGCGSLMFTASTTASANPVVSGTTGALAPVPGNPEPVDSECYRGCWERLQQALDDVDDYRETVVNPAWDNYHDLRDEANSIRDAYQACIDRTPSWLEWRCNEIYDDFADANAAADAARRHAENVEAIAAGLENQAYADYAACIADCDGNPR